jgi:hypothetical protein
MVRLYAMTQGFDSMIFMAHRHPSRPDDETLRHLYLFGGPTSAQIAAQVGVSPSAVWKWLRDADVARRKPGQQRGKPGTPKRQRPDPAVLRDLYEAQRLPAKEVAERLGVHWTTVIDWLRDAGVAVRPSHRRRTVGERRTGQPALLPDAATFCALYGSGLSLEAVGERYGVSTMVTTKLARAYGVSLREGGYNGGRRHVGTDRHRVRSSYELMVCEWLTARGIVHEYEPSLPLPGRWSADFRANGWYIEIWGMKSHGRYRDGQEYKRAWYRAHNAALIELSAHMFAPSRAGLWERRLARVLAMVVECGVPSGRMPRGSLALPGHGLR